MVSVHAVDPTVLVVLSSTQRRGAEVEGATLAAALTESGLAARVVALGPAVHGDGLDVEVLGRGGRSPQVWWRLRRLSRHSSVVVAYGSTTLPATALALLGSRVPWVYRSIGDPAHWAGGRLRRSRTGLLLRRATSVVALWPEAGRDLVALYGVAESAIAVIPNSRDPRHFSPSTQEDRCRARETLGLPADALVVAVVGALSGEKRPALGIEVVRKIPSAWLVLAGGGPLQPEVERLAADSLAGRSVVLGPVGDVRSVLAAANVVLVCSATEGMPGVVIEAALMGRRVVVPAVGACPTMISEGLAGALVSADADAEDVASAVRTQLALADPPPNPAWSLQPAVGRWSALLRRLAQREVQERL